MPNIEIHGLDFKEALEIQTNIQRAMGSIGLGKESATEIFDTITRVCEGIGSLPYLQIIITRKEARSQLWLIKKALRREGITLPFQILLIEKFDEIEKGEV
jgi:hypothetical protein